MTVHRPKIPAGIADTGVLAIARRLPPTDVATVAEALEAGGIRAFELTLNEPESTALEALVAAVRHCDGSAMIVGAGTVLSLDSARRAVDAGATFLVAPHVDAEVVAWAARNGVPMLPGAATASEVLAAWRAGAAAVKVFPASSLGAAFVREMRGPFPDIPLLPTGGVSVDDAAEFIDAGAVAVGIGSWLFAAASPAAITERSRQAVEAVAAGRAKARGGP